MVPSVIQTSHIMLLERFWQIPQNDRIKLKLKEGALYAILGTLYIMDGTDFRMITAIHYRHLGQSA